MKLQQRFKHLPGSGMRASSLKRMAFAFLTGVATISLSGCASTPQRPAAVVAGDYGAVHEYVTQLIRQRMKASDVPGLSVALVDDQRIVWAEGFGYADREKNIPATADTVYRVGSISKLLTATAAMQLAEQGRMDIDKPLQTYLPSFSVQSRFAGAQPITPRTLMTHHSGLPRDLEQGMWNAQPEPFTKVVEKLRNEYAAYPPNYVWAYSNVGVTLLGHAIQNVTGKEFAAHLDEAVLRPLGMTHSAFSVRAEGPLMARAYHKGRADDDPPLRDVPAGGLNSSVNDLSRFLQMVFAEGKAGEDRVLKPETVEEMLRPQNAGIALDMNFKTGLGWILGGLGDINIEGAGPVAHHGGATMRYNGQMVALPRHKLGVVVLANASSAKPVVDEIATETLTLALEAKTGIRQPDKRKAEVREQEFTPQVLQNFPGYYTTFVGDARVGRNGNRLSVEALGRHFDLVAKGDGTAGLRYKLLGVLPVSLGALDEVGLSRTRIADRELLVASTGSQRMVVGERIEPVPIPAPWLARRGEYQIVNGEGDYTRPDGLRLLTRDGFMAVEARVPNLDNLTLSLATIALNERELLIPGLGEGKGETIRVVDCGGRECITYSGYVFRKKAD